MSKYYAKAIINPDGTIEFKEYDEVFERTKTKYDTAFHGVEKNIISKLKEDIKLDIKEIQENLNLQIGSIKEDQNLYLDKLDSLINSAKKGYKTKVRLETSENRRIRKNSDKAKIVELQSNAYKQIDEKKAILKLLSKKNQKLCAISKRSLSRTRQNVINTIRNNTDIFVTFITLTFKENIADVDEAFRLFKNYIKKVRSYMHSTDKELYYLAIPEFQKRGAVHFHMVCNIPVNSYLIPKRSIKKVYSEGKIINIEYYDIVFWKYGYSTAFEINKQNDAFDISLYLIKYLYKGLNDKDNQRLFSRQKVLKSQNLKKPEELLTANPDTVDSIKEVLDGKEIAKYWHIKKNPHDHGFEKTVYHFKSKEEFEEFAKIIIKFF